MDEYQKRKRKVLFISLAGALTIAFAAIGGFELLEFMDSPAFCGDMCHEAMSPQYTTYKASPHSRVACTECHIGPGTEALAISKIRGITEMLHSVTGNYERPLQAPVKNMRPGRETCEQCHRPDRFPGDIVRIHTSYASDERNTEKVDTRVLMVGGGESGVAQDIHWHIAANVWYLPLDENRQEIGWVGVEDMNGKLREYVEPGGTAQISPQLIEDEKRLMDCMDCHNRATHIFRSPGELIDMALTQGKIDKDLPFIKREGLSALDPPNSSLALAMAKIEVIKESYKNSYPQVYAEKEQAIDDAIDELKEIATLTTFPDMKVTWETYADNSGHQQSPGCLRCHGTLVAAAGDQAGKVIDGRCNLCHSPVLPNITNGAYVSE